MLAGQRPADTPSGEEGSTNAPSGDQGSTDAPSGDQGSTDAPSGDQGSTNAPSGDQGSLIRFEDYPSWEDYLKILRIRFGNRGNN